MKLLPSLLLAAFFLSSAATAQTGPEPSTHPLVVLNGTGSGNYVSRTIVPITAQPELNGLKFVMWLTVQGGYSVDNITSPSTTLRMKGHPVQVAAVYANVKVWYPPAGEPAGYGDPNQVGLFLARDMTTPPAKRREMKIQVTADVGGSGSLNRLFEFLTVRLDWFPAQQGLWHSRHVKFFTAASGGTEIPKDRHHLVTDAGLLKFIPSGSHTRTATLWYEPQWSTGDQMQLAPVLPPRPPPKMNVGSSLYRFLGSAHNNGAYHFPLNSGNFTLIRETRSNLLPVELTLHRRGTINTPGAAIPRPADSNDVYEVVTLENADFDEQTEWTPNSMASAGETNRQDGATEAVDMERDDDFVKIRLHAPLPQMPGSIELVMDQAGQGDRMQADDLRFYNDQGQRILLENLVISDLQNPQGPLAPMLQDDGQDLFVEIADLGQLTQARGQAIGNQRRYADLILRLTVGGQVTEMRARIYRGGYWRNQRNGNTGTIAFYDGKGRYQDQNGAWQVDVGDLVHGPFNILSGTGGVTNETVPNAGPTPVGWYGLYERLDINEDWQYSDRTRRWSRPQQDHNYNHPSGGQQRPPLQDATGQYWQQGSYSQWSIAGNRTQYTHRGATTPPSVQFKFELVNWGHNAHRRTFLQIHPDGWNDGTAGCVGLQNYNDCCQMFFLLRHYFGTRLHIETP